MGRTQQLWAQLRSTMGWVMARVTHQEVSLVPEFRLIKQTSPHNLRHQFPTWFVKPPWPGYTVNNHHCCGVNLLERGRMLLENAHHYHARLGACMTFLKNMEMFVMSGVWLITCDRHVLNLMAFLPPLSIRRRSVSMRTTSLPVVAADPRLIPSCLPSMMVLFTCRIRDLFLRPRLVIRRCFIWRRREENAWAPTLVWHHLNPAQALEGRVFRWSRRRKWNCQHQRLTFVIIYHDFNTYCCSFLPVCINLLTRSWLQILMPHLWICLRYYVGHERKFDVLR